MPLKYRILEDQEWEDFKAANLYRFYRREFPDQEPPALTSMAAVRQAFPEVFGTEE